MAGDAVRLCPWCGGRLEHDSGAPADLPEALQLLYSMDTAWPYDRDLARTNLPDLAPGLAERERRLLEMAFDVGAIAHIQRGMIPAARRALTEEALLQETAADRLIGAFSRLSSESDREANKTGVDAGPSSRLAKPGTDSTAPTPIGAPPVTPSSSSSPAGNGSKDPSVGIWRAAQMASGDEAAGEGPGGDGAPAPRAAGSGEGGGQAPGPGATPTPDDRLRGARFSGSAEVDGDQGAGRASARLAAHGCVNIKDEDIEHGSVNIKEQD